MSKLTLVSNDVLSMHTLDAASSQEFACATFASKSYVVSKEQAFALYALAVDFTACKALASRALADQSSVELVNALSTLRKLYRKAFSIVVQ